MITTYMPGASGSWLLQSPWPTRDAAGNPKVRRPGHTAYGVWEARLMIWGMAPNDLGDLDEAGRLWRVVLDENRGRKKSRSIRGPTSLRTRYRIGGWRINVWAARLANRMARTADGVIEGPVFWLTYNDARRLWADRDMHVTPHVDRIEVRSGAA